MEQYSVVVPRGFPSNGTWIRRVNLRQLTGYDEEFLYEMDRMMIRHPDFLKTISLLKRIVTLEDLDGKISANTPDIGIILQNMDIGDRNMLLLSFRSLMSGDKLQCVTTCPKCTERMSVDCSTQSILKAEMPEPQTVYTVAVGNFIMKLRPITGVDEEAIILENYPRSKRAEYLVRSCIISSDPPLGNEELSDELINNISSKLSEIDPLADIIFELTCPSCQHVFETPFAVEDFILQEFRSNYSQLEFEVNWLALNYHWSEQIILSLPIKKRKKYINLINRTLFGDVA
jgi:hypothetical protein